MKIRELFEANQYRPLSTIAQDIRKDWKNISPYAKPYLDAMADLDKLTDKYHADDAKGIVLYFLSNASTWKGEVAKKIKAELKSMLANKPVKESLILEGINFGVMQQKIYDYVLKKLKEVNPGMHFTYAAELARTTDQFWTPQFDKCLEAFNKAEDITEIEDELEITIEEVSNVIIEFFADSNNHPSGYAARKYVGIDRDTPNQEEIDALVKKIDPNLEKELANRS
jgi:hypothetical protein